MNNKVVLLTYHPLTAINGGTVMYRTITSQFGKNELFWIATGAPDRTIPSWMQHFGHRVFPFFIFRKWWLRIFTKPGFNLIHGFLLYYLYPRLIINDILRIIRSISPCIVWIEGVKQTYVLGYMLLKHHGIPVHLSINDDITANCPVWESRLFIQTYFRYLLFNARSIDFISEEMRKYYKDTYGYEKQNNIIFWIGDVYNPLPTPQLNRKFGKIIFYGSIHGFETIESFCSALDNANKQGSSYKLDIFSGADYSYLQNRYSSVEFKGSLPPDQLRELLSSYDLVYVPMSFRKDRYAITRTSISVKMIMALQTQIPILAHGPIYSSNTLFTFDNRVGFRINSLSVQDILSVLQSITFEQRSEASRNAARVYREKFNTAENISRFKSLLLGE